MPSKLSFKGDPKVSKKRKHASTTQEPTSTSTSHITDEDAWTSPTRPSDLNGPIIIVFPSISVPDSDSPPQSHLSLACDPNGAIYPSPLHNTIESDPATAEPDSIQQVWQCHRLPGSSSSTGKDGKDTARIEISLKAPHGGYLAADSSSGLLSAKREARGLEEGWCVEEVTPTEFEPEQSEDNSQSHSFTHQLMHDSQPRFRFRTLASLPAPKPTNTQFSTGPAQFLNLSSESTKTPEPQARYLSIVQSTTNANAKPLLAASTSSPSDRSTHLILRMQTRFKPNASTSSTSYATSHLDGHPQNTANSNGSTIRSSEKVSRKELEAAVGRNLTDDEMRRLKRARREGNYHEEVLDVRVKGKHDKFA